jgi:hypothetical protein
MKNKNAITMKVGALVILLGTAVPLTAQKVPSPYPKMAPLEQYLMERNAEIALARSAAPESISRDADVMVLGRNGYEKAVAGKNGFVCVVDRAWASPPEDPGFWNPKQRGPICFNPAAARSFLPRTYKRTSLLLAGKTKDQMVAAVKAAIDKKELPAMEPGAMCYMLSKQGYLNDRDGHWRPHLMFFFSGTTPPPWGADLDGSPVIAFNDKWERLTTYLVPVRKWSDGTMDQ